jgi:hypothetical protein
MTYLEVAALGQGSFLINTTSPQGRRILIPQIDFQLFRQKIPEEDDYENTGVILSNRDTSTFLIWEGRFYQGGSSLYDIDGGQSISIDGWGSYKWGRFCYKRESFITHWAENGEDRAPTCVDLNTAKVVWHSEWPVSSPLWYTQDKISWGSGRYNFFYSSLNKEIGFQSHSMWFLDMESGFRSIEAPLSNSRWGEGSVMLLWDNWYLLGPGEVSSSPASLLVMKIPDEGLPTEFKTYPIEGSTGNLGLFNTHKISTTPKELKFIYSDMSGDRIFLISAMKETSGEPIISLIKTLSPQGHPEDWLGKGRLGFGPLFLND